MPSTFTGNTGIELIADGEQSGLWGQTTNGNLTIVDRALNGSVNISLSGTTHTLTTADGVLSDGQFAVLVFNGSPSGTNTVSIEPNTAQKTYFVTNSTAQTVVLSQGSGATVSVPVGRSRIVFTNGAGAGAAVFDITNTLSGTMSQQNATAVNIDGGTIDGTTIGGASAAAGTFTTATATTGNITTVNATTVDTTNIEVTNIKAKDGTASATIADITGVLTVASSVLTTADINGGTIDGTTIGGTTAAAGTFTSVSASGNITVGGTVDGRDVATDGSKLDGIEAGADVTDTANVTAAGALMDSELTDIAAVKALNQGVATTDSPSFAGLTATTADIDGGTIDGTVIGGSTPAAISGTTGTFTGNLTVDTSTLFVDAANNRVGVGTTNPAATFHANSGLANLVGLFESTDAGATITLIDNSTTGGSVAEHGLNTVGNQLEIRAVDNLSFETSGDERMRIDASGNLLLAGTGTPTSSVGNLVLYNGTAPTGNATNGVILYAEDVSASSELKVRDEAGNVTTLSPHNFDLIPEGPSEDMAWSYYSERDGKRINVDMLKAIRLLEQISGEKLVHMV